MIRIGLLNAYSTHNIGDAAIYAAYVQILQGFELACDLPGTGAEPVTHRCDAFISVGGDIFNNARPRLVTRRFLRNLKTLYEAPGDRTLLFGQSIPPSCRGFALFALSRVLRRLSSVFVRDEASNTVLRRAGVDAQLSFDTAFGLKPTAAGAAAARALLDAAEVRPEHSAFISLRGFSGMYAHTSATLVAHLQQLAAGLARRGHAPVALIQSAVDGMDDDRAVARELAKAVPALKILDFTRTSGTQAWDCAAAALSRARVVVAIRYHTAVLRMLAGRSSYNLFYSNKGADLVTRLGQPGCDLATFDVDRELDAVERSAETTFDIAPVRAQVRSDLRRACRKAIAANRPIEDMGAARVI